MAPGIEPTGFELPDEAFNGSEMIRAVCHGGRRPLQDSGNCPGFDRPPRVTGLSRGRPARRSASGAPGSAARPGPGRPGGRVPARPGEGSSWEVLLLSAKQKTSRNGDSVGSGRAGSGRSRGRNGKPSFELPASSPADLLTRLGSRIRDGVGSYFAGGDNSANDSRWIARVPPWLKISPPTLKCVFPFSIAAETFPTVSATSSRTSYLGLFISLTLMFPP